MLPCHWISPFPWSGQDERDLHPTHLFPLSDDVASLSIDAANWANVDQTSRKRVERRGSRLDRAQGSSQGHDLCGL